MSGSKPPRKTVKFFGSTTKSSIKKNKKPKSAVQQIVSINGSKSVFERRFNHTQSIQEYMIKVDEWAADSDDDRSLDELVHAKTINENYRSNEGEKQMMNMWNQFLVKSKNQIIFGIEHMRAICEKFIELYAEEMQQKCLYRNFLLHLCSLHDYNLLKKREFFSLVESLQSHLGIKPLKKRPDERSMARQSRGEKITVKVGRKRKRTPSMDMDIENNNDINPPKLKQRRYGLRTFNSITAGQ